MRKKDRLAIGFMIIAMFVQFSSASTLMIVEIIRAFGEGARFGNIAMSIFLFFTGFITFVGFYFMMFYIGTRVIEKKVREDIIN